MGESSSFRTRVVESAGELDSLAPSWWALLDRASCAQATRTPLWTLTWWSVFGGAGRKLRVVVVEDGGEVVGVVPLARRWAVRGGLLPVPTLELLGSGEPREDEIFSEYIGALAARGHEATVAKAFADLACAGELGRWDELLMPSMSSDDPMLPHLRDALSARGAIVDVRATHECPFVTLPSSWDAYLGQLGSHKRYLVKRTLRDLEKWAGPGGAVLRRARDDAELRQGWEILKALHAERWNGHGVFASPRFSRFHETVMAEMLRGRGGTLDLLWLEVHGVPVAAAYNIVFQGAVQFYQSGRRIDVPKGQRPGVALQILSIRRAIEMGYRAYDFLAQADQYKQQLTLGEARHLVTLSAVAPTLRARATNDVRRTARMIVSLARGFAGKARTTAPAASKTSPVH